MTVLRLYMLLVAALLATSASAEQKLEDLVRLGFFPPIGGELVYQVEYRNEFTFHDQRKITEWSHEISLQVTGKQAPDLLVGAFSIRNVKALQGVETDLSYLLARAIEGESFALRMLEAGAPVEVDWPKVKSRFLERLPKLTDPGTAGAIKRALPVFDPDGITAVMRPLWVSSNAYLLPFRRDAQAYVTKDAKPLAWLPVSGASLKVYGGREKGTPDMLFFWQLTNDPESAALALGPELIALTVQVAGPHNGEKARAEIEAAIAKGITAEEGGVATYSLKPGLLRTVEFEARVNAGDIQRRVQVRISRVKPE